MQRRTFLQGLVGSALSMPIAGALERSIPAPAPKQKRLVLVMQHNGTQQANFWPKGSFTSPILEPLLNDPSIASKTTLVKGVAVPNDTSGTNGNEHDIGFARMFTGEKLMNVAGYPWGGGVSVDQILARAWATETLTLAVLASAAEPFPKPGFAHRRSFSYVGPAQLKSPIADPFVAHHRLFGGDDAGATEAKTKQRLLLRKSILDGVRGDLAEVSAQLGAHERAKLDLHATAVRQLEIKLGARLSKERPAVCAAKAKPPRNYGETAPELLVSSDDAVPELVTDMVDLMATALICGLTRIATLQLGFGGGQWKFAWEGIDVNCHSDVAHLDTSDAGSSALNTERAVKMNRWYTTQVARLAAALDAVPEGDGTMLDNTLIVWANELGRGDHSLVNIPIVLIGRAGGAMPKGGRTIDVGPQPFQRLGCTILDRMGVPSAGFGDAPTCGPFAGLL